MKVLALGNDGRAHALIWKLFNSPLVSDLICAPGNGGTGQLAPSADLDVADAAGIARWAFDEGIDLIVPASSAALHAGVVDEAVAFQVGVCGPSQRSTVLERSRCAAKAFMLRHGLPTAPGRPFDSLATAEKFLATQPLPVIIKADNPAVGEGVFHDRYAAIAGMRELFSARPLHGDNGGVVIESFLAGARVVLSAFTDGRSAVPLLPARLYDRIGPEESSLQARGIGATTTHSRYSQLLGEFLHQRLLKPLLAGLDGDGLPYWGLLCVDCVITAEGPRLTAIRSSFREGEAQAVLPRLEDDLLPWIQAMIARRVHELPPPRITPVASVGLGLFARGYPSYFPSGGPIDGVEDLEEGVLLFHSETANAAGLRYTPQARRGGLFGLGASAAPAQLRSSGGHPLTLVALAPTLAEARGKALANAERIRFEARSFRADIGASEFG